MLNDFRVEYLLIGGYAVAYHGYTRTTGDLDLWVAVDPDNAQSIVEAVGAFGFAVPNLSVELFLRPGKIVRMGVAPIRIAIMTSVSGLDFATAYSSRVDALIDGVSVTVIALEDLKANKRASGRLKDLDDLDHLP